MKMIRLFICFAWLPLLACAKTPRGGPGPQQPEPQRFRTQAYLYSGNGNWEAAMGAADVARLTDLTLAFFHPDAEGKIVADRASLKRATALARAKNPRLRIWLAIGGGSPSPHLAGLLAPARRGAFIAEVVRLAGDGELGFAGVDVDLENELINEHYAGFVGQLGRALHAGGKEMTAALARWTAPHIADSTLSQFDFINVMSYDETGFWNPSAPGHHAPFAKAAGDFGYFRGRGVPAGRLLIGLPFYGYGFGAGFPATGASARTYAEIVRDYEGAAGRDSTVVPGAGVVYYNGQPTITEKVRFALQQGAAGVMIWELSQDLPSGDPRSLLRTIHQSIP